MLQLCYLEWSLSKEYGPGDHSCYTTRLRMQAIFQHLFYTETFSYFFSYSKGQLIATPFCILRNRLLLLCLNLVRVTEFADPREAISYSVHTVFLSPFATSFPYRKGATGLSEAVIWDRSQYFTKGEETAVSALVIGLSALCHKQSPVTNPEPGNWVRIIWKRGTKYEFQREKIIGLAITSAHSA